jgi:hypothetical protein
MRLFSEETRVVYSDAFAFPLAITAIGNTNLAGLKVRPILEARPLDDSTKESRRASLLATWLARFGNPWPPFIPIVRGELGPFPLPFPMQWPWFTPEEMTRVAVEAASAPDDEILRVFERELDAPLHHLIFRYKTEHAPTVRDSELETLLREIQIPMAASPLRNITLGQVFDSLRGLYVVRRLVPGAVYSAAGIQAARSFLEGDWMMALTYATAGTLATLILHVANPVETFSDTISRELAATGSRPQPDAAAPPRIPPSDQGGSTPPSERGT